MNKRYENLFLAFGVVLFALMLTQLEWAEVRAALHRAGGWFVVVLLCWIPLYAINTLSWRVLIGSLPKETGASVRRRRLPWLSLYRFTITGFALNYATPGGLMGGEAYRIMALTPYLGAERASASVILYGMTHIFSHFWFWLLAVVLYVCCYTPSAVVTVILIATTLFCLAAITLFWQGYRHGMAASVMRMLGHVPIVARWARPFVESHAAQLTQIDGHVAALHKYNFKAFLLAVALELACRVASSSEIYLILYALSPEASFVDSILILAFTSLLANLLFFIPLQLGGREGGFMLSITGLGLTTGAAALVALIIRLRELLWVAVGLGLIKLHRKHP